MESMNSQFASDEGIVYNSPEHLTIDELDKHPSKGHKNKKSLKPSILRKRSIGEEELSTDEEVKLLVVSDISQEIVQKALDLVYENYLEKQSVYFVSHCCRLAWKALVEWNLQQKDRGGYRETGKDKLDCEPQQSSKDSWAGHSVPIYLTQPRQSRYTSMESQTEEPSLITPPISGPLSRKNTASNVSIEPRFSKGQARHHFKSQAKISDKIINKSKRSDEVVRSEGNPTKLDEARKDTYELPSPIPLQPKHFPSARVEVQYAIMPGNPSKATNLATKQELKTKTIVLKKPQEEDPKPRQKTDSV